MASIHRATASWTALCAASSVLVVLACGSSESTGPSTGIVQIRASTTGPGLDPDGYVVAVDGGAGQSLPVNGVVTFNHLNVGSHQFLLSGVATNCTLLSPNTATVGASPDSPTAQDCLTRPRLPGPPMAERWLFSLSILLRLPARSTC